MSDPNIPRLAVRDPLTGTIKYNDDTPENRNLAQEAGWDVIPTSEARKLQGLSTDISPQQVENRQYTQAQAAALGVAQGGSFRFGDEAGALGTRATNAVYDAVDDRKSGARGTVTGPGLEAPRPTFGQELAVRQEENKAAEAQWPKTYMAGDVAGSMVAGAGIPGGAALKGATGLNKLVQMGRAGATMGAVEGFGGSEGGLKERAAGATIGGTVGGLAAPVAHLALSPATLRAIAAGGAAWMAAGKVEQAVGWNKADDSDAGKAAVAALAGFTALHPAKVAKVIAMYKGLGKAASDRDLIYKVLDISPKGRQLRQEITERVPEALQKEKDMFVLLEDLQRQADLVDTNAPHGLKRDAIGSAMTVDYAEIANKSLPNLPVNDLHKAGITQEQIQVLRDKGISSGHIWAWLVDDAANKTNLTRARIAELTADTPADPKFKYLAIAQYVKSSPEKVKRAMDWGATPDDVAAEFGLFGQEAKSFKKKFFKIFNEVKRETQAASDDTLAMPVEGSTQPGTPGGGHYFSLQERIDLANADIRANYKNAATKAKELITVVKDTLNEQEKNLLNVDKQTWRQVKIAISAVKKLENKALPGSGEKADAYYALDVLKGELGKRQEALEKSNKLSASTAKHDTRRAYDTLMDSLANDADTWGAKVTSDQRAYNAACYKSIDPKKDFSSVFLTRLTGPKSANKYDRVKVPESGKLREFLDMYKKEGGEQAAATKDRVFTEGLDAYTEMAAQKARILAPETRIVGETADKINVTTTSLLDNLKVVKKAKQLERYPDAFRSGGMETIEKYRKMDESMLAIGKKLDPVSRLLSGGRLGAPAARGVVVGGAGYIGGEMGKQVPASGIDLVSEEADRNPERFRSFADEIMKAKEQDKDEFARVYQKLAGRPSFRKLVDGLLDEQEDAAKSDNNVSAPSRQYSGTYQKQETGK